MIHRTLALAILLAVPISAAAQDLAKDDIVKLKKAGVDDATILKVVKASNRKFDLSSDEIVDLIGAGISEEVINAMLRGPETAARAVDPGRPTGKAEAAKTQVVVENTTSRSFWVRVDPERRTVHFSSGARKSMSEAPRGKGLAIAVPSGSYTVCWCGAEVDLQFKVAEGKTVALRVAEEEDDDCCGGPGLSIEVVKEPSKEETREALYACPMHPDVTSREPGKCRKCGMNLERAKPGKEAPREEKKEHKHDHDK